MTRILACLALAVAFAAAPLALTATDAMAGAKATKICKHKTASGKIKTWRCGKDQPCCSAEWIDYYTCGSKLLGCL
jgi:Ni/Co efflux regulator RcnB